MIFHIALPHDWDVAIHSGADYTMSTRGRTLAQEGFIHCSYAHQIERTVKAFYSDVPEVYLLTISPHLVPAELKVEKATPDGDEFPHIYGSLPITAVQNIQVLKPRG